jgi:hypothetical protein
LFRHKRNNKPSFLLCGIVALITAVWTPILSPQTAQKSKRRTEKTVTLVGRVLAWKLPLFVGAGIGPLSEVFVFGVEGDGAEGITPTKIIYTFFESNGSLQDNFFDHSKRYELQAIRDTQCDESVKGLSYVKSADHESGKPLPPVYVLRFLDGAPKDALKPDAVLSCYILRPGKYKVLSQEKSVVTSTPTTH